MWSIDACIYSYRLYSFGFFVCSLFFLFSFFLPPFPSVPPPFHCSQLPLFILSTVVGFTIFAYQLLLAPYGCSSKIAHWLAGCLATTIVQRVLAAPLSIPRKNYLSCFLLLSVFHFTHPDKD